MRDEQTIGIIGASSSLGLTLISKLEPQNIKIFAFSRKDLTSFNFTSKVKWLQLKHNKPIEEIKNWFYLAPLWTIKDNFSLLQSYNVSRIIAISSTSCFTKLNSKDNKDREIANKLNLGEEILKCLATKNNIEWIILRPTLIYGYGLDKNICEIIRFAYRFRCYPIFAKGKGLRQPIHVKDLANACTTLMQNKSIINKAYNLSGGEILSYREMVHRIIAKMKSEYPGISSVYIFSFPSWLLKFFICIFRCLPRFRYLSFGMIDRMREDLIFSHEEAKHDFGFAPQQFILNEKDLPKLL